jgi:hypothetical protein
MSAKRICALDENIDVVGAISSCSFLDENRFVVSTVNPSSLFICGLDGKQTKEIAKVGPGPFDCISPSIVRVHDGKIYVWCQQQLKLLVYDTEGNGIGKYSFFNQAINNFELW